MIGFEILRDRLLEYLRRRIHNGENTERGLALKAGVSQPHLHNLLKGVRLLNVDTSDKLLLNLGITALDLLDTDELRRALFLRARRAEPAIEVPVLQNRLGPGLPWSDQISLFEKVQVPARSVARLRQPVVARLTGDPAMAPLLAAGDLVVLDNSERALNDDPEALFAVELVGRGAIRWVRQGRNSVYLLTTGTRDCPLRWERVEAPAAAVVRARAIPLRSMHQPELVYDPLLPRDTPRAPAARSVAS